jgi:hypothetical protein
MTALPELPEPWTLREPANFENGPEYVLWDNGDCVYTAAQMLAIRDAGVRYGLELAAQIADAMDCAHRCSVGSEVAAAIRAACAAK